MFLLGNTLNLYPWRDKYTAVSLKNGPSKPNIINPLVKFKGQIFHISLHIKNSKFFKPLKINLNIKFGDLRLD